MTAQATTLREGVTSKNSLLLSSCSSDNPAEESSVSMVARMSLTYVRQAISKGASTRWPYT